jgi:ribosomal protein S12 methylthiotransferase accessory factor
VGDRPRSTTLPALDRTRISVVDLKRGTVHAFAPEELLGPTASTGRLRIVTRTGPSRALASGTRGVAAHFACPNLAFADDHDAWGAFGQGPDDDAAAFVAAAEGVERFAAGDTSGRPIRPATARELGDVAWYVEPHTRAQHARSTELEPFRPDERYLWVAAGTWAGELRWVPADFVYLPFRDPARARKLFHATSSGVAAGPDARTAARWALLELVERDAFMWTWLQGVTREAIAPASLPRALRDQIAATGANVRLINLTLETRPVVLCAVFGADGHGLGLAAGDEPATTAARAFAEAMASYTPDGETMAAEAVSRPRDHRRFYASPERREAVRWLWSGPAEASLGEVAFDPRPIEQLVADACFVQLTPPGAGELAVVRALTKSLIPITFGFDAEPLGMSRAAHPVTTYDGRTLGETLTFADSSTRPPHAFA